MSSRRLRDVLRAPVVLTLLGAGLAGTLYLLDRRDAEPSRLRLTARVERVRGRETTVSYVHPAVATRVEDEVSGLGRPEAGAAVAVTVDVTDPYDVRAGTDTSERYAGIQHLAWAVPPLLWLVGRTWHVLRTRRLARGRRPTFAMTGVVVAGRRGRLDLYPLDASALARPVASVPLLTTGEAPLGVAIPVQVKGTPRPRGLVVARWGGRVLWPARGCSVRRFDERRPERYDAAVPEDVVAGVPRYTGGVRYPDHTLWLALGCAAAAVVGGFGTVVTRIHAEASRRVERHGVPIVVKVTDVVDLEAIEVAYTPPGGSEEKIATAPVYVSDGYEAGQVYPARIERATGGLIRLAGEPYSATDPIVIVWLPAVALGTVTLLVVRTARARRRVAHRGPWRRVRALVLDEIDPESGDVEFSVGLVRPGSSVPCCYVDADVYGDTDVLAAGVLEPGSAVALRRGDELVETRGRAYGADPPP